MICKKANVLFPKGRLHENSLTLTELPNDADDLQKCECYSPEGPLTKMLWLWQNCPTMLMICKKANVLFPKGRLHENSLTLTELPNDADDLQKGECYSPEKPLIRKCFTLTELPNNADDLQKGECSFPEGPLARKRFDFDRTAKQCWQSAKRRIFFSRRAACTKTLWLWQNCQTMLTICKKANVLFPKGRLHKNVWLWQNCPTMLTICKKANVLFPKGRLHKNALTLTELPNNVDNLQKGECSFPEGPLAQKRFDFDRTAQQCWQSAKRRMFFSRKAAWTQNVLTLFELLNNLDKLKNS